MTLSNTPTRPPECIPRTLIVPPPPSGVRTTSPPPGPTTTGTVSVMNGRLIRRHARRPRLRWCVAVVQAEGVAVGVPEDRHPANTRVHVVDELHPALLELRLGPVEVVDVQRDRVRPRLRGRQPEAGRVQHLQRQRPGLELPARHLPAVLRLLALEHFTVELLRALPVGHRDHHEVDARDEAHACSSSIFGISKAHTAASSPASLESPAAWSASSVASKSSGISGQRIAPVDGAAAGN